ncbi:MAG: hypothetical protein IT429_03170, partial [Gemmataceae bacterium]|nr:hypothetical protein [Gemmataceae bacterium]
MPYTPIEYIRQPYVRQAYQPPESGIGDLLRVQGHNAAQAQLRQGDIGANMWANIGNTIQGSIANYQQQRDYERERAEREAANAQSRTMNDLTIRNQELAVGEAEREVKGRGFESAILPKALRQNEAGVFTYDRDLLKREFEQAGMGDRLPMVFKGLDDADASMQRVNQAKRDTFAGLAFSALQLGATPEAFEEALHYARENDLAGERHLERYAEQAKANPQSIPDLLLSITSLSPDYAQLLEPEKPLVLGEGQRAVDPRSGQLIAEGGVKTPTNIEAALLQARQVGDAPEVERLMGLREQFARAGQRPERINHQWVTRDGQAIEIPQGSAQPGDVPFTPSNRTGATAGGYSAQMPADVQNTLDRAILSVPGTRRGPIVALANRMAETGDFDGLKDVIRQAAIEGENVDVKNQIMGRMATLASLSDTREILEEMQREGIPTNWLSGTWEDLNRKVGASTNPRLVELSNRLMGTLINYRRAATGVQFSQRESQDYQRMFPNYRNLPEVNLALIRGLEREMTT